MRIFRGTSYVLLTTVALFMYGSTLQTNAQAADSGELQLVALTFGVAHPPGYPLWSMLAGFFARLPFFVRLPWITPLVGIALFSLVTSVAALLIVAHAVETVLSKGSSPHSSATAAGIVAAVALGVSATFWAQATSVNIRSLTALFAALLVWAAARSYAGRRAWPMLALIVGFGVAHHPSLLFPGAIVVMYVLVRELRGGIVRRLFTFVLLGAATQVVWLYLPLRDAAGAALAPGTLRTWNGLLDHALARGFGGDMFWYVFVEPQRFVDRLLLLPNLMTFVFSEHVAIAIGLGAVFALLRRTSFAWTLLAASVLHLFITLTYRAPQTVEYALPAWVMLCALFGVGVGVLAERMRRLQTAFAACMLLAVVFGNGERLSSFVHLARDATVHDVAAAVLMAAPVNGVVLAQWHQVTPMWVIQEVEAVRRDVRVEYVAPHGAQMYAETFAARAKEIAPTPVLVTSYFAREYARAGIDAEPIRAVQAWRMLAAAASATTHTVPASAPKFDDRIRVWVASLPKRPAHPGEMLPLDIGWQLSGEANAGEAITLRIFRGDGRLAANVDVQLNESRTGVRRRVLGIPLDLDPGDYALVAGAYRADGSGFTMLKDADGRGYAPLAMLRIEATATQPATQHAVINWRGENRLVGVDYDLGLPGRVRLWVHFRTNEYTATVMVMNAVGQSLAPARVLVAAGDAYQSLAFDIPPERSLRLQMRSVDGTEMIALRDYVDGERYVSFGNRMVLTGIAGMQRGDETLIDVGWLSAQPLIDDYIVSVRAGGVAHDGVPMLGALPTLKWLRGSHIDDRHPLSATGLDGQLGEIVVYDSVSHEMLPVLDERYEGRFTYTVHMGER